MNFKITKDADRLPEFLIDGKPIERKWLKAVNLKMVAGERSVVTLEYHVKSIEIDGVEIDEVIDFSNEELTKYKRSLEYFERRIKNTEGEDKEQWINKAKGAREHIKRLEEVEEGRS